MKRTLTAHATEVLEAIRSRGDEPSELITELALELLALNLDGLLASTPAHCILELQGLGKSLWQGMDAQDYVDRERAGWNS